MIGLTFALYLWQQVQCALSSWPMCYTGASMVTSCFAMRAGNGKARD